MERALRYVTPEYQERLDKLASVLVTPERFGKVAVNDQLELDLNGYAEVADCLLPIEPQHGWDANGEYR